MITGTGPPGSAAVEGGGTVEAVSWIDPRVPAAPAPVPGIELFRGLGSALRRYRIRSIQVLIVVGVTVPSRRAERLRLR